MDRLPEGLYATLFETSNEQLAKYFCRFNAWEFPEELLKYKPEWWGSDKNRMYAFLKPVFRYIQDTIGVKACNREWNRETMSDEEHEAWWRDRYLHPENHL